MGLLDTEQNEQPLLSDEEKELLAAQNRNTNAQGVLQGLLSQALSDKMPSAQEMGINVDLGPLFSKEEMEQLEAQNRNTNPQGGFQSALQAPEPPKYDGLLSGFMAGYTGQAARDDANYAAQLKNYQAAQDRELANWQTQQSPEMVARRQYAQEVAKGKNADPAKLRSYAALSSGLDKVDPNSQKIGNALVDGLGRVLYQGQQDVYNTAPITNARMTARGYGIQEGTPEFADLVAAYAEPSPTITGPDGSVRQINAVSEVIQRYRGGGYGQGQGQAPSPGQNGQGRGQAPSPGQYGPGQMIIDSETALNGLANKTYTQDQAAAAAAFMESAPNDLASLDAILEAGLEIVDVQQGQDGERTYTLKPEMESQFGKDSFLPNIFPEARTSNARVNRFVQMIGLEERQKLRGQGTISDSEAAALAQAATMLQERGVMDEAAAAEVGRIIQKIEAKRNQIRARVANGGYQSPRPGQSGGLPPGFVRD